MIITGLDFSLELHIYRKSTEIFACDVAYWRKNWGMVHDFLAIGMKPDNYIEDDWDFSITCNTNALDDFIYKIREELENDDSEFWTNSVFDKAQTKFQTIRNLGNLYALRDFLNRPYDLDTLVLAIYDEFSGNIVDLKAKYQDDMLEHPDDYNFKLVIINSY